MEPFDPKDLEDLDQEPADPFFTRHPEILKQIIILSILFVFFGLYKLVSPVQHVADLALNPAVTGITKVYSTVSNLIYKGTGLDLGFVKKTRDAEFDFHVHLATLVREKRATELIDIAVDQKIPVQNREKALESLFKFDSSRDWVQPFLNELFKGGMVQLYDAEAPLLDKLIKQIRKEGGIQNQLVRAYAEVVFGFMLQVPDQPIVRQRALSWISDVLPEEAILLIEPRIRREKDPETQNAIEEALWNVRVINDQDEAYSQLYPYYRRPPWPTVRLPLAVIMSRLGHPTSFRVVKKAIVETDLFSKDQQNQMRLALKQKDFPRKIKVSPEVKIQLAKKIQAREEQYAKASRKQKWIQRQEDLKEKIRLAREQREERQLAQVPKKPPRPVKKEKEVDVTPKQPIAVAKRPVPQKGEKAKPPPPIKESPKSTSPKSLKEKPLVKPPPEPAFDEFEGWEEFDPEEIIEEVLEEEVPKAPPVQVAAISKDEPKEIPPPPIEEMIEYITETEEVEEFKENTPIGVDMIFQVTSENLFVYDNFGQIQLKVKHKFAKGTKGKASQMIFVGEDEWYFVTTKERSGWAKGDQMRIYDLSPSFVDTSIVKDFTNDQQESREESTYFEPSINNVAVYGKPSEKSNRVTALKEGQTYLALESKKVEADRWFRLQVTDEQEGWVQGFNLQLALRKKPKKQVTKSYAKALPGSMKDIKSAFAPEWIEATVKGVGVYERTSFAAEIITTISPPDKFKVVDMKSGGGKEWYQVELKNQKKGWVQALDVKLTKK